MTKVVRLQAAGPVETEVFLIPEAVAAVETGIEPATTYIHLLGGTRLHVKGDPNPIQRALWGTLHEPTYSEGGV